VGVWTAMHYSDSAHLVAAELEAKLTPIIERDEQAATNLERARNWLRKRRQASPVLRETEVHSAELEEETRG